jgi:predicted molibdopterin-dependent oxidoreductase YjgC
MTKAIRMTDSIRRGEPITIVVDGEEIPAFRGETVAAAMLAAGRRTMRYTLRGHEPRGLFCGMGVCFDCSVRLEGSRFVRSCVTVVENGMKVWTTEK